ncbi:bifunctional diguanylate cyclase/phosphodiesterase [Motiliproteus sp. SC1-56]|uniref:putative bifunctional diguanylate cyclase/phosphodiesterase n=1 Tax=Motiliproteus sp. SC1-56 TaxID=2799565 RepID=UPI001A8D7D4A|nr:EAL domain-containing protein [Motiliproteus sp. SC1-56]
MPRSRILRLLTLIAVVGIFAASTLLSYQNQNQAAKASTTTWKSGGWAAAELEADLNKLQNTLLRAGMNEATHDELMLRFDLLWSRLDTVRLGREARDVRALPEAQPLLDSLLTHLQALEPRLLDFQPGDQARALALNQQLQPFAEQARRLNVASYIGQQTRSKLDRAFEDRTDFNLSMIGLFLSGGLLVAMLVRENARNLHQSLHDALTGLANRKQFNSALEKATMEAERSGTKLGILVIDLNNFKEVNDTLGHHLGDKLLKVVAQRLRHCVRSSDTLARLGGDEFAVIHRAIDQAEASARLARRIGEQLAQEVSLDGQQVLPSASIGVSVFPDDADTVNQVFMNADLAMYRAKQDSGQSYRLFEPAMNAQMQRSKQLGSDLPEALSSHAVSLHYQPILRLYDLEVVGVEALLRWHHPEYGYVTPPEAVKVAEEQGLAKTLDEWVLRQVCLQHCAWQDQGLPTVPISVNISPAMFTQHDLVAALKPILKETAMPARDLILEVTEDTIMRDMEQSPAVLSRIKALGVGVTLDNFGSGYSSLSHLKRLPIDRLKMDRAFIEDLNQQPKEQRFIRSILSLAQSLEIERVAEGIERQSNLDDLRAEGCELGQGFLLSQALPAEDFAAYLQRPPQPIDAQN